MPWDITIVASGDQRKPLGERDDVIACVAAALPGVVLQRAPVPPPDVLARMPDVIRDNFLRPKLQAELESGEFIIQFYADDLPTLHWIGAEVRGNGDSGAGPGCVVCSARVAGHRCQ